MSVYKLDNGKIEPLKKMTGAEIIEEEIADAADTLERLKNNPAEDPFAATDAAKTAKAETKQAKDETKQAKDETKQAKDETKQAKDETEQADSETKRGDSETKKRDWVEEAYKCFIKDVKDLDPTDPVKAIEVYFEKNATDELKARCKAEGKDAKGCWKFIEAVAMKALGNRDGHIDPSAIYVIAMHWFEDVPKDWDRKAERSSAVKSKPKKPTTRKERLEERVAHGSSKAKAELRELKKKGRAKAAKAARPDTRKKKPKQQQGFFFEMLETPATAPEAAASGTEQESEVQG